MPGSLRIGRVAGIRIEIHFSWLIILALLTGSLATGWFPYTLPGRGIGIYWTVAFAAALLLFVSVLAHELGHSLIARARHLPVRSITLFVFGGVSNLEQEPPTARDEFQVAAAGPVVSAAIAAIAWPLGLAIASHSDVTGSILIYLGAANFLLAVFNLVPAFPLDGGRILRAALWSLTDNPRRATRWASLTGQAIALLFVLAGLWMVFDGRVLAGLWTGFTGIFIFHAARSADAQVVLESLLRGVVVQDIMNSAPETVPATITLRELLEEHLSTNGLHAAPVVHAGQFLGLVTCSDVRSVPEAQWDETLVGHVMVPLERVFAVSPEDSVGETLALMNAVHVNQFPVVQGWQLAGMLSREAIARYVAQRQGLPKNIAEQHVAGLVESLPRAS